VAALTPIPFAGFLFALPLLAGAALLSVRPLHAWAARGVRPSSVLVVALVIGILALVLNVVVLVDAVVNL
jgi:hypothetical protein